MPESKKDPVNVRMAVISVAVLIAIIAFLADIELEGGREVDGLLWVIGWTLVIIGTVHTLIHLRVLGPDKNRIK